MSDNACSVWHYKRHKICSNHLPSINKSIKSSFIGEEKPLMTQMQERCTIEIKKYKSIYLLPIIPLALLKNNLYYDNKHVMDCSRYTSFLWLAFVHTCRFHHLKLHSLCS